MRARLMMRVAAACGVLVLLASACGNSGSSKQTTTPTGGSVTPGTTASAADLSKHVTVKATGVTDTEIRVAVITDATNILGGHFAEFGDGVQAYFDWINSQGGIYGRKLVIVNRRDDKMTNNLQEVKASLNQDNAFATFVATTLFTGANELDRANQPTFTWNINPEFAGHGNIFGHLGALCHGCLGQGLPALARANHFTKVAVLGYGVSAESQLCARGIRDSFKKYTPEVNVAVYDENIGFAEPNLAPQVTQMKNAGVQFVMTCMDAKETLVLAKEMKKQSVNAIQELPNGYDQQFIADNAQYYEGDLVAPQFVPFEKSARPKLEQTFLDQMHKSGKPIYELTAIGWIDADQFVTGLKLAGPNFSQQKVIDGLNTLTSYSAGGMIVPIDWTKQHNDPSKNPAMDGKWNCASYVKVVNGKFVPVYDQPDKPWVCGGNRTEPTLAPLSYQNFENANG